MERAPTRVQHPALLSLGTCVGPWRVVAWAGRGIYGAVYKAVRVGEEHLAPVALKLALLPKDPRFAREAALLSRTLHPSIPRLIDADDWRSPTGTLHPYVTMEWIEGAPLYDWARQYNPTSQQVLRLLSQLADALAALHAQGAVHRDVKGGNVLVRLTDSRAMLTDFGAGNYPGAATLTLQSFFPGTPAYLAPEDAAAPFALEVLADDTLPALLPGQTRPNSKRRCPCKGHVPLNGGCWVETPLDAEGCGASGYIMVKNKCYSPALTPRRQPNSSSAPQQ